MDDGEAVGIDGAVDGLGHVVIHDPEDGSGEEEGDGVVAVPPLDEGVLDAAEEGVGMGE